MLVVPGAERNKRENVMPGPLSGVRVLDLTGVVSGPYATMFLADQGADVLKIEPIGGDITRRSRATIDKGGEFSALFISSNRGKRSLSIDVKSTAGREVLAKLVAQADVLVQNFRPGTMERLGLGADELRQRHPRLIYVSISGVGDTGPYVKKRVYDPIIQGLSGFADIQSQPVTNRPQMIRTIVCDKTTAVFTAQAVSSALYAREKTGQGDHIQCRDAGCHDFVSVAGRHDAVHGGRRRGHGGRSQRSSGPRVQDQRRLHHGRHHFRFRMAGFLPGVGRSGARQGSAVCDAVGAFGQRHRPHQQDGGIHRPAYHRRMAGTARCRRRSLRADPAPRRDHP